LNLYLKIILILFGLAYLISPVDIIPDLLLPFVGWIDDSIIIGTIIYLIRYGKLPDFFFKKQSFFKKGPEQPAAGFTSSQKTHHTKGSTPGENNGSQNTPQTPYEILGIDPNASKNEIKTAYKEAIKKYHPDKVSHLGQEFSNLANKKFLEIQEAYANLMNK